MNRRNCLYSCIHGKLNLKYDLHGLELGKKKSNHRKYKLVSVNTRLSIWESVLASGTVLLFRFSLQNKFYIIQIFFCSNQPSNFYISEESCNQLTWIWKKTSWTGSITPPNKNEYIILMFGDWESLCQVWNIWVNSKN